MSAAVARVTEAEGAVGVLINNAGYSQSGAVESVALDDVRRQFETNVFGLIRMCQLVLPGCASAGRGRSSTSARWAAGSRSPAAGIYHATKYAVEAISDALRFEVRGFGVDVILIEPGLIVTSFGEVAAGSVGAAAAGGGPYADFNRHVAKTTAGVYKGPMAKLGGGPEVVADDDRQGARRQAPQGALPGHAQRAPDDRPAPLHARPRLGPDDARAVPHAQALTARRPARPRVSPRNWRGVLGDAVRVSPAQQPRTARWPPPSSAPRRPGRRRCRAACRRSRSSAARGCGDAVVPGAPAGDRRAARRGPRSRSRSRPGRREVAADPGPLELQPRHRLEVAGHQRQRARRRGLPASPAARRRPAGACRTGRAGTARA